MRARNPESSGPRPAGRAPALPESFLNCYEIIDPDSLRWNVGLYKARRANGLGSSHSDRAEIKQAIWGLKKKNPGKCPGYGYVIDLNADTAAVPANWKLPSGTEADGRLVTFAEEFETDPENPSHQKIIEGILREAVKRHFKENTSDTLGTLWQDYDRFCQTPNGSADEEFLFCRKFGVATKVLRGNRWVLQLFINTATVDGRTFREYYLNGDVLNLARMIRAKMDKGVNRQNRPLTARVLRDQSTPYQTVVAALDLADPSSVEVHGRLSRQEQIKLAGGNVTCQPYGKTSAPVPLGQVRLILDTQLTGADHTETIISPEERHQLAQQVRDFLHGLNAYGQIIPLAESPMDSSAFPTLFIPPPALRVRDRERGESLIRACDRADETSLRMRGKTRLERVRKHGFLHQRPINPLVAWPERFGQTRAERMKDDLNQILRSEGIEFSFREFLYRDADQLNSYIQSNGINALLAVLPEGGMSPYRDGDMHESIKQRIRVPSQCIHHDHTLPPEWVDRTQGEMGDSTPRLAGRIRQSYELCIWNLLVKHHWVPFAPNDPFHFNLHVGLDVGGRHNNRAMACLGYGFKDPRLGLLFRPEEIPIDSQKAEPIPTESLYQGLLRLFETTHKKLSRAGHVPNFDTALFFRDGRLLGDGNSWNELDALKRLHKELVSQGMVSNQSVWTATEIMKQAEDWRLLRDRNGVANPVVGHCLMPFDSDDVALVCTSGAPYLTQGTASPLKVNVVDIHGAASREHVLRDLIWEADMCFTKLDMGMHLPWVLHVADAGALQSARSYKITGVTA